ncbi:CIA30-domain-containing protein [Trichoderma citrinoviride]|uniref:CIA30-domain-containing protein n=1 Tax=Trichoderma citrinoviride TaxID=58853 RepID=A0A2T4BME5_9HYPO|nr:CIA30-domain-containing protein [Trichoderma citrinoviride]PTB70487.1 CIA30-domain-containing protein [Trichoderma citrinoviride]
MMRATQPMLARGFLARSFDELKRRSSIAWNLEAVKGPSGPRELYDFHSADSVSNCVVMSDTLIGGSSTSHLDFIPATSSSSMQTSASASTTPPVPSSHARFYGHISTSLPPDRLAIQRTGYAAFRTPDQPPTAFGRSVWDIDPYTYLALRVKSDGRAYYVNVQTESVEPTDLHQHRLFAKRPGQWETVLIRWNDFVRTNHGFVVEPQTELLRQRVHSVGIGLTDRVEGPFELCIERVWATNGAEEKAAAQETQEGELKNRKGEKIQW